MSVCLALCLFLCRCVRYACLDVFVYVSLPVCLAVRSVCYFVCGQSLSPYLSMGLGLLVSLSVGLSCLSDESW